MKKLVWDEIEREQLNPLLSRRFLSANGATVARFELKKGCVVPQHEHANGQISWVVEGALRFSMPEAEDIVVRSGEVLVIPPEAPHAATAEEDCVVVDVFTPERADWAAGKSDYLKGK